MKPADHQAPKLRQIRSRDLKLREGLRKKEAHEVQVKKDLGGDDSEKQRRLTVQKMSKVAQQVCPCRLSCWHLRPFHVAGA